MTHEEIEQHRGVYPLPYKDLCLYSSFGQILGKSQKDYTFEQRKKRWDKVMSLDKEMKEVWEDNQECIGCEHLNGVWCSLIGLPCTVNPTLTFKQGVLGMACQGVGFENKQLKLW